MRSPRARAAVAAAAAAGLGFAAISCADAGTTTEPTTTTLSAAAGAGGYGGFGVDHWPPASWRPYGPRSPLNTKIPPGTQPVAGSAGLVATALSAGPPGHLTAGVAQSRNDWGHPTYYSNRSDPVYTLRATGGSSPINGARINIPSAARPAGGGDAHMTVVTPDGWEYDMWEVRDMPSGGGTVTFSLGGRMRIDGNGTGSGGTASRLGNLGGIIRAQELAAGRINHALFIVLRCAGSSTGYGYGAKRRAGDESAYVYPAVSGGSPCPAGVDAPPMGARLRLAMSNAQIDALHLPTWKRGIIRALARYGGYVGDTGGDGIGLMFESSTTYAAFGRPDPLVRVAQANGVPSYGGTYAFDVGSGIDWSRYLRVVPPPRR